MSANARQASTLAQRTEHVGPYVLLDRIGRGGMAEVFVARLDRDGDFHKLVALKRMVPDPSGELACAQRFLDEARTVAKLNHPNLVQVFDMGTHEGRSYLVMELVDGIDLYGFVNTSSAQGKPIPTAAAVYIAAEVARGLGYVHAFQSHGRRLDIVHRDISPQNLILGRNGEVKILDFGIAKANTEVFQRAAHTQHNAVLGKMRYMSPEQLDGGELDGRCDLYALGVVLFELLTARRLIDAKSPASIVRQVRESTFKAPSETNPAVPPELDAIVAKMLAREVGDRYADGATLSKALYALLAQIAPGYGRADLGELVESRIPMKPSVATSSAVREVSLASILEEEIIGTPSGGEAGARPLTLGRSDEPSGLHDFDEGIASKLEPLASIDDEPSIEIIRPSGALPSLQPERIIDAIRELTPVPSSPVSASDIVTPMARPAWRERKRSKRGNTLMWGAAAAVWVSTIVIAVVLLHSRNAPAVAQQKPSRAPVVVLPIAVPQEAPVTPSHDEERTARRAAPVRTAGRVRHLDGKIVVGPGQDAPPGAELAVARARRAYDQARVALSAGKHAVAEAGFERSISEYPGYVPAYRGLASAYLADGQPDLALDALDTSARFASDGDRLRLRTAIAMLQRGEEAELPPLPAP